MRASVFRLLTVLALGLALLRGALAPGMMLAAAPEGLVVSLCTAHGGVIDFVMAPDGSLTEKTGDPADDPCPFATAQAPAIAPEPSLAIAPMRLAALAPPSLSGFVAVGEGLAAPPPPAHAPPEDRRAA